MLEVSLPNKKAYCDKWGYTLHAALSKRRGFDRVYTSFLGVGNTCQFRGLLSAMYSYR